jgi:hypothetical protein
MWSKHKGMLAKFLRRDDVINVAGAEPAPIADAPDVEAVRIKRIDANNLLRRLEQELSNLLEDKALLAEQYAAAKASGDQLKTEIIARSFMGVEQTIVLKKNLYGELAEVEQMLSWDENRSAFDFISKSFSLDLDKSQKEFSERIARHTITRRKQFDLAQTVKEGEAALARMRDDALDETMAALDQVAQARAARSASDAAMVPRDALVPPAAIAAAAVATPATSATPGKPLPDGDADL